jgi:hypothetical protein
VISADFTNADIAGNADDFGLNSFFEPKENGKSDEDNA